MHATEGANHLTNRAIESPAAVMLLPLKLSAFIEGTCAGGLVLVSVY